MERNTFKIAEQEMKEKAKEDQEEKKIYYLLDRNSIRNYSSYGKK